MLASPLNRLADSRLSAGGAFEAAIGALDSLQGGVDYVSPVLREAPEMAGSGGRSERKGERVCGCGGQQRSTEERHADDAGGDTRSWAPALSSSSSSEAHAGLRESLLSCIL